MTKILEPSTRAEKLNSIARLFQIIVIELGMGKSSKKKPKLTKKERKEKRKKRKEKRSKTI